MLGTATLDTMGGLITNCNPQDLPEGASPRCYDVDFIIGSVFTRAGLVSVYTYASVLHITDVTIGSGRQGVFTYTGPMPTPNEGFVLSNFIGSALFLNGQTVVVEYATSSTFTALVVGPSGTYTGLFGTATSVVGQFVGPNIPTQVTVTGTGNAWSNPSGVIGDTSYATVTSGSQTSTTPVPADIGTVPTYDTGGLALWNSPTFIVSTSQFATISLTSGQTQAPVSLFQYGISIPEDATVTGIKISVKAFCSVAGVGSLNLQLVQTTGSSEPWVPYGTVVNVPLATAAAVYTAGSTQYQWGTTLRPSGLNNNVFGVQVSAAVSSGTATVSANSLSVTVTYVLANSTTALNATGFVFAVPSTIGVTGFGATFQAYTAGSSSLSLQLLKNGVPVGQPIVQPLTSTPTIYSVGGANDLWGSTWFYSDVNNVQFGVQITASGEGGAGVNDLDVLAYVTPALTNFNYVKSFIQNNGQTYTLALDNSGIMWIEDVTNDPNVLSLSLSGILPGTFAQSATVDNEEFVMFSNLSIGTDRPRIVQTNTVTGAIQYLPLSQVGPGAPPTATAAQGSATTNVLNVTTWAVSSGVVTWTYTPSTYTADVDSIWVPQGVSTFLNGQAVVVLSGAAPGTFTTNAPAGTPNGSGTGGTLTIAAGYTVHDILQSSADGVHEYGTTNFNGQEALLSSGPTSTSPGNTVTYWYGSGNGSPDPSLLAAFATGNPVYVYLSTNTPFFPGQTVQVLSMNSSIPPHQGGVGPIQYFTAAWTGAPTAQALSNPQVPGLSPPPGFTAGTGNDGNFQVTMSTLTLSVTAPLSVGDTVTILNATPSGWNSTWTIETALDSGVLNITEEQITVDGSVTYSFNSASVPVFTPVAGDTISITGATGAPYLNGTFVIGSVGGGTFTVSNPAAVAPLTAIEPAGVPAVGTVFGRTFVFDPGAVAAGAGSTVVSIFGDYTPDSGTLVVAGSPFTGVGAGTRQVVCFFITETEYFTAPSPTFTFDISGNSTFVSITHLPIGPPNVIARGIAFTEAGQNGVPGANFYYIPNPVTQTINGATTTLADSTVVNDNVTTDVNLVFTDAVLLNSVEIDIEGNDLFNLIELGSAAWVVPYTSRNFYGLSLSKVNNFNNLSFDGGYLSNNPSGSPSYSTQLVGGTFPNLQPLGWNTVNVTDQTLAVSPVTGNALYIKNTYGVETSQVGMIYQTAYLDSYLVPIVSINTSYSVRVAASAPSGILTGTLVVDLVDYSRGSFGTVYGSYNLPFSMLNSTVQVFDGTLLVTQFPIPGTSFQGVSPNLQLRVWVSNMGAGADVLVERLEVYPTTTPYLKAQVLGSYTGQPEAIDASSTGGIIDTTTENAQPCMGGFVMHDLLYLLKTSSWYSTQDNPNSEPGGWGLKEVSNKVGTIGINSYDVGEEWCLTACRAGIYGFDGGAPTKISQELWNLWEQINWEAGNTIVLRNDIVSKRMYCAIPLPTGTNPATGLPANKYTILWLPNAPYNPKPTSPNVMLMLNYQGLANIQEMMSSPEVHTTMFGTLAAVDMKRKWSIWNIATPYMQFIMQPDGESTPLYICNGIGSSKIYTLDQNATSDDGVAINGLYTTYGFVNAAKAATLPIFGFHAKRYTVLQLSATGTQLTSSKDTNLNIRILPNTLTPKYPYTVPIGVPLVDPANDDYFRSINVKGNRAFIEVSTNAVGSAFNLSKILLTGKADAWSTLNPTGGGNAGIA